MTSSADSQPLSVQLEPIDDATCRFVATRPVHDAGSRHFTSETEAAGVPVAEAVLEVPGICEVTLEGQVVTATKDTPTSWADLEDQVRYAILTALTRVDDSVSAASPQDDPVDDDAMFGLVEEVFRGSINPQVAEHGGSIELIDVQEGTVVLRLRGGCRGCGMATVTLRQGIDAALRRSIAGYQGFRDITDHASGTDPYFAASSK